MSAKIEKSEIRSTGSRSLKVQSQHVTNFLLRVQLFVLLQKWLTKPGFEPTTSTTDPAFNPHQAWVSSPEGYTSFTNIDPDMPDTNNLKHNLIIWILAFRFSRSQRYQRAQDQRRLRQPLAPVSPPTSVVRPRVASEGQRQLAGGPGGGRRSDAQVPRTKAGAIHPHPDADCKKF